MKLAFILAVAGFLYLFQNNVYRRFWKAGLAVSLAFDKQAVVCQEEVVLFETIRNQKALPLAILKVNIQFARELEPKESGNTVVTDQAYRSDIFSILPYQQIKRRIPMVCRRRGHFAINQAELISYDLFFIGSVAGQIHSDARLYVYPREVDAGRILVPFQQMMGAIVARNQPFVNPFEFRGIREYQSYDSLRDVNWKATARTGDLKTNLYEPTAAQKAVIFLNVETGQLHKSEDLLEESISLCATLVKLFLGRGILVSIVSNGMDGDSGEMVYVGAGAGHGHGILCLQALSRLNYKRELPYFEQVMAQERFVRERAGILAVLISATDHRKVQAAFQLYQQGQHGAVWIQPVLPGEQGTAGDGQGRIRWEVEV